ncbi:Leucine Rich Repeat [Seminavis robusta]|uniref:Leucine Rich Repeat n=1 Tax=Seminavis robusta TaxID=568900 RepID=A0A9N8DVS8_9STRA|nr:Leucine Rich Repeat [Seminavis robusta]|eukprot:Sro409_g137260.1 Leucine Rich Repeat (495) ;mRNA; f:58077-59637
MFITVVLSFHLQNQSKDQPEAGRSNRPGHIDPNLGAVPRKDYLLSLLPEYTKDALGVTTDNNPNASLVMTPLPFAMLSPQAKAFAWTINDPIFDSYEPWKLQQRFALACFYYATGGETSWNSRENWLSYNPNVWEEHWFSKTYPTPDHHWISWHSLYPLVVEEPSQEFNHLWLIQNGLQGTLPPELFLLTSLRSLDLTLNPLLGGTIPSEIGNLHRMEILMFLDSTMTGELPTELGQLSNLLGLYAQSNYFHGGIPSQVSLLQDLIVLDLASSNLSGPIPSELGLISPLGIWLEENELDSHIPTEIGLTKTQLLSIHGNLLTGTIPSQLGMLLDDPWLYKDKYATLMEKKAPKVGVDFVLDIVVHVLDVGFTGVMMHQNLLTGSIPTELGTFSEGEVLNLAQNSLTGAIPSELGLLSNLLWLGLSENQLSGQIPSEVGLLSNLKYLLLHQNPLTGLLPDLGSLVSHGNLGGITINATGITVRDFVAVTGVHVLA